MTNKEEIEEMQAGLQEAVDSIKSGELSVKELEDVFPLIKETIMEAMELAKKIMNNDESPGLSAEERASIKKKVKEAIEKYDKKEHKKAVKAMLKFAQQADIEIDYPLFFPFIVLILETTMPLMEEVHADSAKVIKKQIKKFSKKV